MNRRTNIQTHAADILMRKERSQSEETKGLHPSPGDLGAGRHAEDQAGSTLPRPAE